MHVRCSSGDLAVLISDHPGRCNRGRVGWLRGQPEVDLETGLAVWAFEAVTSMKWDLGDGAPNIDFECIQILQVPDCWLLPVFNPAQEPAGESGNVG